MTGVQTCALPICLHAYGPNGADVVFEEGTISCNAEHITDYRRSFDGIAKWRRWQAYDAAYFFGYALINYFSLPFSLTSLETVAFGESRGGWSWVLKRFPRNADTHSEIQRFWFDESGLLQRHDYRADVLGAMFTGAHFSLDYRFDLPIPIAERRLVRMRFGKLSLPVTALQARFTVSQVTTANS